MARWEYRIQTERDGLHVTPMNNLGDEQWELVSVFTLVETRDMRSDQITYVCVFKREKQVRSGFDAYTSGPPAGS